MPAVARVHGQRADLAEIGPQHVQGATADDRAAQLGHAKVRHVLVERHEFLGQQLAPGAGIDVDEGLDGRDVGCARAAHRHRVVVNHVGHASGREAGRRTLYHGYPAIVSPTAAPPTAAIVTLGCARNEVDSEELAGRLTAEGWRVADPEGGDADVVLVNTCGFVASAKKDSIDALLAATELGRPVVAVGCLAERYGDSLADALPEVSAVLGFDAYPEIAARLRDVTAGRPIATHQPVDRRRLLPVSPTHRPAAAAELGLRGHGWLPRARHRLDDSPIGVPQAGVRVRPAVYVLRDPVLPGLVRVAADRRGAGRGPLACLDGRPGARAGQRELDVVRQGSRRPARARGAAAAAGCARGCGAGPGDLPATGRGPPGSGRGHRGDSGRCAVLRSVLPAREPSGCCAECAASAGPRDFLELVGRIRGRAPHAGVRSNVIVGFPGETEADVAELERFLIAARLDVVGVFGYSDEDGTEAEGMPGKLDEQTIAYRVEPDPGPRRRARRAARRGPDRRAVTVLVDAVAPSGELVGTAAHQAPEVDGYDSRARRAARRAPGRQRAGPGRRKRGGRSGRPRRA